jgi:hypothetical protein
MTQVLYSVLELSSGSVWKPHPALPPYLVATPGDPFPDGGDAWVVFTDTSGGTLATIYADSVTADAINFIADPSQVDPIPAGANFEIFVDSDDGPVKIRYGIVNRREVQFLDSPARQQQAVALQFADTFPTLGLRTDWIKIGAPIVHSNQPNPNGVGPAEVTFGEATAGMRWAQELNSDTVRMKIRLFDWHNAGFPGNFAHCVAIVTADQRMTTGLAVDFSAGAVGGMNLHLCTLNGSPWDVTYRSDAVANTIPTNGDYTIYYDSSSDTLSVYKGNDTTPLVSWEDDVHIAPHGPGYRHFGAGWHNSQQNSGVQLTYIAAKDDV